MRPFLWSGLEEAALDAFPELRPWRRLLDSTGADHWRISGSGSAFFGLYDRQDEAEEALASLLSAAGNSGLGVRAAWAGPPAGCGANIVEVR
jgi:4-diphosphocytidyl-2C-methyl-D-erythritol kinase